ncbi:aminocarboxymuconate-semialdehyde decarboxylase [Lipingzhangella halophila]|uniref:Aminocarboxymuconate-semialdehyde decarboxylase n=1 Tax=Lipingzhangella halophila TaxID=1783352 RepID=A0A7W7W2W7_9ACTN|nr:amidohydrolase family protein [Lipingzhangella halophila]MBB4931214.1 aminocarboxymuconate-semialdehyde decarboxylase [Lipingzhangella halophila]
MRIDCHAHMLPAEFPADSPACSPSMEPIDGDTARELVSGALRFKAAEVFFAGERRLEAMANNGVDAEVLTPMPPLLDYGADAKDYREVCRYVNETVLGLCATDPRRMYGFGIVPLQDPGMAAAELGELKASGLRGVEIGSHVNGRSIGEEEFLPFFAEAERLDLPIFVHAIRAHIADRLPMVAGPSYQVSIEATLAAASLLTGGTAVKHPGLRISFSHGAGGLALMAPRAHFFWGGTWNEEEPLPGRGEGEAPMTLMRRFFYDALVFDRRALRALVDLVGADRLLLGSDFPAMDREEPFDRTLASLGLDPADSEAVGWSNAWRYLGIEPPEL